MRILWLQTFAWVAEESWEGLINVRMRVYAEADG